MFQHELEALVLDLTHRVEQLETDLQKLQASSGSSTSTEPTEPTEPTNETSEPVPSNGGGTT